MDALKDKDIYKKFDTTRTMIVDKLKSYSGVAVDAVKEFAQDKVKTKVFHKEHQAPKNIILKVIAIAAVVWDWTLRIAKGIAYTVSHPEWPEFCAAGVMAAAVVGMIVSFFSDMMKKLRWLFAVLAAVSTAVIIVRAILRPRD